MGKGIGLCLDGASFGAGRKEGGGGGVMGGIMGWGVIQMSVGSEVTPQPMVPSITPPTHQTTEGLVPKPGYIQLLCRNQLDNTA